MSMIDILLTVAMGFLRGTLALLPEISLPSGITTMGDAIGTAVATANGIFPVVTLGICLAALLVVKFYSTGLDVIVWLYQLIPFKAT